MANIGTVIYTMTLGKYSCWYYNSTMVFIYNVYVTILSTSARVHIAATIKHHGLYSRRQCFQVLTLHS